MPGTVAKAIGSRATSVSEAVKTACQSSKYAPPEILSAGIPYYESPSHVKLQRRFLHAHPARSSVGRESLFINTSQSVRCGPGTDNGWINSNTTKGDGRTDAAQW